jgi:LysR family hydrogen peroxide-inducible transcriptional activator
MEMHQLRYFVKVAECGHFTRAAEACHVAQPSLSQQIAKLERELGQPLFDRLGRGVRLTEAGRLFKERADQILRLADDARACAADDADAGRLVVAAIPTVAPYFLPPLLTRFFAERPRARVEVMEETTARILALLAEGEIDLAVLALPVQGEHLETTTLFTEELMAMLPAGHPLADKPRLTLRDLAAEPFVLLHEAHCLTGTTLSFCSRLALAPVVTARMHQLSTVQELVRLGKTRVYRSLTGDRPTRTLALAWNPLRFQSRLFKSFAKVAQALATETAKQ